MMAIGSHTTPNGGATVEWLTPLSILSQLGPFDLDPCCPRWMPWRTARVMLTAERSTRINRSAFTHLVNDGITRAWNGRVWLNPHYGRNTGRWLAKLADHGHGTAIVFARTETEMFVRQVWNRATALLFIDARLHFHLTDGSRAKGNAGGPSVLIAYGASDAQRLKDSGIAGAFVAGWQTIGGAS